MESHQTNQADQTNNIATVHTTCKQCIFGKYNEDNIQIGCHMGRIELLQEKCPQDILEVYDDDGDNFFVINNRRCIYKRSDKWLEINKLDTNDISKCRTKIDQEITIQYQIILFIDDNDIDTVENCLYKWLQQTIAPKHITIVRENISTIPPSALVELCQQYCTMGWKIENVVGTQYAGKIIDNILKFKCLPFYCYTFVDNPPIPNNTLEIINNKIHNELFQFAAINFKGLYADGYLIPHSIHQYFNGNKHVTLISKLQEEKCESMIHTLDSIL